MDIDVKTKMSKGMKNAPFYKLKLRTIVGG
jgi:hypothetical protein